MIYIANDSADPAYNLALEEFAFSELSEDVLLLWISAPSVVCGKFQNPYREVDVLGAARRGIPVLRRESVGGAVYHDPGNINYSFIRPAAPALDYDRQLSPVIRALNALGIPAERRGASEIAAFGKKVSGSAQRQSKGRELAHGTLLFDSDLEALHELTSRPDEQRTRSKGVKSQPSEVRNMRPLLPRDMGARQFLEALRGELLRGGETVRLNPEQDARVRETAREKYESWAWNFGRSPEFTRESERPPVSYAAKNGVITAFSLGGRPVDAFVGARLEVSEIEAVCRSIADSPADAEMLLSAIF